MCSRPLTEVATTMPPISLRRFAGASVYRQAPWFSLSASWVSLDRMFMSFRIVLLSLCIAATDYQNVIIRITNRLNFDFNLSLTRREAREGK